MGFALGHEMSQCRYHPHLPFSLTVLQDPLLHTLGLNTVVDGNPWHAFVSFPAGLHATVLSEHLLT